jgi:phage terminase small subunit
MPARKSTKAKRLIGSARKDRTKIPPAPAPGAARPEWLDSRAGEWWDALAPGLTEDGLLTDRSAMQFAVACDAMSKIEALATVITPEYLREHANAKSYPQAVAMQKNYVKLFQEASGKLGLSPADWQKIDKQPPLNEDNEFFRLAWGHT